MTIQTVKNVHAVPIMPVTMLCDNSLGDVAPPLPAGAFSMGLFARPGSGKSTFLENLLSKKAYYRRRFDHVHVFIPPNSLASLPKKSLLKRHDKVYDDLTIDRLEKVLASVKDASDEEETSLIIIDDMLHALKDHEILRTLEHIFCNRRHLRTSTIISTQVYNSLPLVLRKCLSHAVLWKLGNGKEQASVLEELFPGVRKEDAEELLRVAHKTKHDFLIIDLKDGRYHNSDLDELVVVQPTQT